MSFVIVFVVLAVVAAASVADGRIHTPDSRPAHLQRSGRHMTSAALTHQAHIALPLR